MKRSRFAGLLLTALLGTAAARAADTDLAFSFEISGDSNVPTITVTNNSPTLEFNACFFRLNRPDKNFDGSTVSVTAPVGGTAAQVTPLAGIRNFEAVIGLTGFGPGKSFSFKVDIDGFSGGTPVDSFEDYSTVFFNNALANASMTLVSGPRSVSLTLDDRAPGVPHRWRGPKQNLVVQSLAETNGTDYVRVVDVKVDDGIVPAYTAASRVGEERSLQVPYGSAVEISAPRIVYKDINGSDITSSVSNDHTLIEQEGEERFTALGISVNDVPQTADPSLYRFEMLEDTQVELRWEHEYALTVRSNFDNTASTELVNGQPLAGPLASQASGNPAPLAQKHWIKRGTSAQAQIDGSLLELMAQPGLDIRYVVESFRAYGPPNSQTSAELDRVRLSANDGGTLEAIYGAAKSITAYAKAASGSNLQLTVNGHGLSTGMRVRVAGTSAGSINYDGNYDVTVVDPNNFTVPVTYSVPGNSGGTALRLVDTRKARTAEITAMAATSTTTVITSNSHGLRTGAAIIISGCSDARYNGEHTVTVVDANTVSIPVLFTSAPVVRGNWTETTYLRYFPYSQVAPRQVAGPFNMWGPAGITWHWKIQYGVRVNTDAASRNALPSVYEVNGSTQTLSATQDSVYWFDPGKHLRIYTDFRESTAANAATVNGWHNGDGYHFPSTGTINSSDGTTTTALGSNVLWKDASGPGGEVGLEIFTLNRPARVLWRYGSAAYAVNVTIGQYAWEGNPALGAVFTRPPGPVDAANATFTNGVTGTPGPDEIVEWDPVAGRLYPLLPGTYTVPWKPGPSGDTEVSVLITATLPVDTSRKLFGHYPHVAGSPPVALDPDPNDNFTFRRQKFSSAGAAVDGRNLFTATSAGFTVLQFSEIQRNGRGLPREFLKVRVVDTKVWNDSTIYLSDQPATVGTRITDTADAAELGTGFVRNSAGKVRFNPFLYNAGKLDGLAVKDVYDMQLLTTNPGARAVVNRSRLPGPIFPVNKHPGAANDELLTVVWYDDPARNDLLLWPHRVRSYTPQYPVDTDLSVDRIVIATQWGSESPPVTGSTNALTVGGGSQQITAPSVGSVPAAVTYDPSRLQAVTVYQQPDPEQPGYNPNEEHALLAPSLRYADVSPRPPAVYALRENDLNTTTDTGYTSDPFVLVQFFDTAIQDHRMKLYRVVKDDQAQNLTFAAIPAAGTPATLNGLGHVEMKAGEPVIPFYPLGVAIGAAVPAEIFGNNLTVSSNGSDTKQLTYWEDHKGSTWAVSGGTNAWFSVSFYYPLATDFYWPANLYAPPVRTRTSGAVNTQVVGLGRKLAVPQTGDAVAFLPSDVRAALTEVPAASTDTAEATPRENGYAATLAPHLPTPVLYHANWPSNPPVLKAGETLTFSGGENRADNPTTPILQADGTIRQVETPGLPQVLAFASAEVVFDSQNPTAASATWSKNWTGRVVQALDVRRYSLPITKFPSTLQPAGGKTRVSQGKFIFNDLPASLQKRLRYDPIGQRLELTGLVNDKGIGANDLTAAPPAVYVLEPNILTADDIAAIRGLSTSGDWIAAANQLYYLSRDPDDVVTTDNLAEPAFTVGLVKNSDDDLVPARNFGPGLALIPYDGLLDPDDASPAEGWITVVENNDPALGGAPITPHIIKVDRRKRYRGAIKVILSDNVFDENVVLRHTGDFGGSANQLSYEWWYRPDDGSLNVPPPDRIPAGTPNPWKLFPDTRGLRGAGLNQITLKGNPNAPEALLADTWWFCRYRHADDDASGSDWRPNTTDPPGTKKYEWAGAGNNDPFHDFDLDGVPDYRAQLAMGWLKRVLDAVNPYEARIRDFEGENPATNTTMISQFGPRFEGPVALNPAKDVIENVGLIELYETVLKRGRDLSIDLSRPVSTPAVANALQLVSTRLSDFYTLLGNEAYTDSLDPTIGFGSEPGNDLSGANPGYGSLAPAIFTFMNQQPDLISEELGLLRGVDDFFARPVYNRLFWNFTKDQGEAAYAVNYNISDVNLDGFVNEADAMKLYPMGHGDAWGHYLTAVRKQYALLNHPSFNWVSRSESYNLQNIVITVDFLDERKFAATAAAKAKAGAEIVNLTYREKFVEDPEAQWQGYTDSNPDRAWGVDEWARRAGQGAYFDWITANALLPSEHPNTTLEGVRKVDRRNNSDIAVISANLSAIQTTMDNSNRGQNPLGLSRNALVFDIDPTFLEVGSTAQIGTRAVQGLLHFDQIYERALKMLENAQAIWNNANTARNMLRAQGNSEIDFRNGTFQEDLSYRNQLIQIFGTPYEGTVGPGKLYPAGYEGPDLSAFMYVNTRQLTKDTVPGPTLGSDAMNSGFAAFDSDGVLNDGDLYRALNGDGNGTGTGGAINDLADIGATTESDARILFNPTFASSTNYTYGATPTSGLFAVNYTDLTKDTQKVRLTNYTDKFPITAAGYTFQAPSDWGMRRAPGELQSLITQMLVQEAAIAEAVGAWDSLSGQIVRTIRLLNARLTTSGRIQIKNEGFVRAKYIIQNVIKGLKTGYEIAQAAKETVDTTIFSAIETVPRNLPTGGFAISPGDALAPVRGAFGIAGVSVKAGINATQVGLRVAELMADIGLDVIENELNLFQAREERDLQIKEWLKELEDLIGDEPIRRITIFKEIQALQDLSGQYRAKLAEGVRLIDERAAFNKRVAAQTQRQRYNDMTLRVSRNHALQTYRSQFDLAAKYAWLAAKAYDYETNYDESDPGSPAAMFADIVRARTIGLFDDQPRRGAGGLSEALATLKANYESQRGQLGLNTPQRETGKMSLRTQMLRILPKPAPAAAGGPNPADPVQPGGFPSPGMDSNAVWAAELNKARVPDLWEVPEFRYYCRPFAPASNAAGKRVPQPGLVFRFGSEIMAGKNFFGKPLAGGDQAFDPTNYTTKIVGIGVWFSDYLSSDVLNDLAVAPRAYLIPVGSDIMRVPHSLNPDTVRIWSVLDQAIPVPLPALHSSINNSRFIPLLDTLNGPSGEVRKFSSFRAYHNGEADIDFEELVTDSRLIGRSVWNTAWILIVPGQALNADPDVGLDRFIQQVSDISIVFETYGLSGG